MWDVEEARGRLADRPQLAADTRLTALVRLSESGAAAFIGTCTDGNHYWIKADNNPQGVQTLVNERVVHAAAQLIDAPVRPIALIELPPEFDGAAYGQGLRLRASLAHGSRRLDPADLDESLLPYRSRDDNAARQARLVALWDWCMGEDPQWLYDSSASYTTWSFDHGWWIGGGDEWSPRTLVRDHDRAWSHEHHEPIHGLSSGALSRVADRLQGVTQHDCLNIVSAVPRQWETSPTDLAALAEFLFHRSRPVAARLREMMDRV